MEAVIEQALGIVEEARRNGGLASLFVTVFPALQLLDSTFLLCLNNPV